MTNKDIEENEMLMTEEEMEKALAEIVKNNTTVLAKAVTLLSEAIISYQKDRHIVALELTKIAVNKLHEISTLSERGNHENNQEN